MDNRYRTLLACADAAVSLLGVDSTAGDKTASSAVETTMVGGGGDTTNYRPRLSNQQLLGFGYQSYFHPFWVMATRPLTRPEQFLPRTSDRDRVR